MKTEKRHRAAIVILLNKVQEQIEHTGKMLNKHSRIDDELDNFKDEFEVELWFLEQQKKALEEALVEGELKDW
jgi:hypothetical protein